MKTIKLLLILTLTISLSVLTFMSCGSDNGDMDTTVTKQEWNEALASSNFTIRGFVTERDRQESLVMKVTDSIIFTENDGRETFVVKQDDGWHMTNGTDIGPVINGVSASVEFAIRSFHVPEYESFVYDEQTKSYVYINSDSFGFYQFSVFFENGVIVKIEGYENIGSVTHVLNFTNYGTTDVEIPSGNE